MCVCVCARARYGLLVRCIFLLIMFSALAEVRRLQAQPGECPYQSPDTPTVGPNQCTINDGCDGLSCPFGSMNESRTASLYVEKCTDPLEIGVYIYGSGYVQAWYFTSSGTATSESITFELTTSRNASYVDVQVYIRFLLFYVNTLKRLKAQTLNWGTFGAFT